MYDRGTVYKTLLTINKYDFLTQVRSNLRSNDVLRLSKTPHLVTFLVGWLVVRSLYWRTLMLQTQVASEMTDVN